MKSVLHRRPSASLVVSIIALVVAMSGTAIAASHLVSGDKLIKKHSLSGNRLRNHTLTGKQINLNKLGKVPSAKNADQATLATTATSATSATTATNATELGGQPASAFESAANVSRSGLVTVNAGQSIQLATFGPFTLKLTCSSPSAGEFISQIDATSTESNSDVFGTLVPTAGGSQEVIQADDTTFDENDDNVVDFISPSGGAYEGDMVAGVDGFGANCFALSLVTKS